MDFFAETGKYSPAILFLLLGAIWFEVRSISRRLDKMDSIDRNLDVFVAQLNRSTDDVTEIRQTLSTIKDSVRYVESEIDKR